MPRQTPYSFTDLESDHVQRTKINAFVAAYNRYKGDPYQTNMSLLHVAMRDLLDYMTQVVAYKHPNPTPEFLAQNYSALSISAKNVITKALEHLPRDATNEYPMLRMIMEYVSNPENKNISNAERNYRPVVKKDNPYGDYDPGHPNPYAIRRPAPSAPTVFTPPWSSPYRRQGVRSKLVGNPTDSSSVKTSLDFSAVAALINTIPFVDIPNRPKSNEAMALCLQIAAKLGLTATSIITHGDIAAYRSAISTKDRALLEMAVLAVPNRDTVIATLTQLVSGVVVY